ncbi:MAG: cell division protein FtsQ [Acidobacteria bacterium]|nr:cell division protein FtsQ [Acidobacteriota bacterium]
MEIHTSKVNREAGRPAVDVPPDRRRGARKRASQKAARSGNLAARIFAAARMIAVAAGIGMLAAAGLFGYRYAATSNLLSLRNIDIEGCRHADPTKIESIVRSDFPANILQIDLNGLRRRLEQENWIRRVEIRRILPAGLKIYVEERLPSVIAEIGGELILLDNEGILLDEFGPSYGRLDVPVFRGLKGDNPEAYRARQEENTPRVRLGVEVLKELQSGITDYTRNISEVDLSEIGNVKILLIDDAAEISMGDRDFLKRFQAFAARYGEAKSQHGEILWADLRFYPTIVFKPKETAADQGAAEAGIKTASRN